MNNKNHLLSGVISAIKQKLKSIFLMKLSGLVLISLIFACLDTVDAYENRQPVPDQKFELVFTDSAEIYTVVDEMPEMIGGLPALYSQIEYPRNAIKAGIEGRVFIQFVVDPDGNVLDPTILRDIGAGCGKAAIEAIREVKFEPGRMDGQKVHVQFSLPVRFKLEN